jgi:spermidine synthase
VAVPSFGVWGSALAHVGPFEAPDHSPRGLQGGLRFLNDDSLAAMFQISSDLAAVPVEINRLDNQVLVRYHESEWRHWD